VPVSYHDQITEPAFWNTPLGFDGGLAALSSGLSSAPEEC